MKKLSPHFNPPCTITPYAEAVKTAPRLAQSFEHWVTALTWDNDGEQGWGPRGALNWIHTHYPTQVEDGLFQTFIVTAKNSHKILATATICDDDRGVGKNNNLGQDAFIGFVQVDRHCRGQGLGNIIFDHVENHIQNWINAHPQKRALNVKLFTANPLARRMYEKRGYAFQGNIFIPEWNATEAQFQKIYKGKGRQAAPKTPRP